MFRITFPGLMGAQTVSTADDVSMIIQALLQNEFIDYTQLIDNLQMDMKSHKQKIYIDLAIIPMKQYTDEVEPNVAEKITELKINLGRSENLDTISAITEEDSDKIGTIYFPEPFKPYSFCDQKEAMIAISAYINIAIPELTEALDQIEIVDNNNVQYKAFPSINVIPLAHYVKMKRFVEIKINAIETIQKHFNRHAFKVCPECRAISKQPILSCSKCGFTKKLDQNIDNI